MSKNINSVRIKFETLTSFKSEVLTFVPNLKTDEVNGDEYVESVYCLEQQKEFSPDPFMPINLLPNYLQSIFPKGRVITNPEKN